MSVMKVDVRPGETITFGGGEITVTMTAKSGQRARLEISADDSIKIGLPNRTSTRDVVSGGVNIAGSSTRAGSGVNNSGSRGGKGKGPPRQ